MSFAHIVMGLALQPSAASSASSRKRILITDKCSLATASVRMALPLTSKSAMPLCEGITVVRSNTVPAFAIALLNKGWASASSFCNESEGNGRGPPGHEEITRMFAHLLRGHSECHVVDVGMNVGFYSLQSAALGCSVDAFEIQPRMHQLMNLSLSLNPGLADRIRPHALAVTVDTLSSEMLVMDADAEGLATGSSVISAKPHPKRKSERVATVRLDDFMAQGDRVAEMLRHGISLLKVDVEGFELDVLSSAIKLIRTRSVANIIVEIGRSKLWSKALASHGGIGSAVDIAHQLLHLFDKSGYECRALRERAQPSTPYISPGSPSFDPQLASWPRGMVAGSTPDAVEFTIIRSEHFEHFLKILMQVDFNVWFRRVLTRL